MRRLGWSRVVKLLIIARYRRKKSPECRAFAFKQLGLLLGVGRVFTPTYRLFPI
jgi:hypothetical protein